MCMLGYMAAWPVHSHSGHVALVLVYCGPRVACLGPATTARCLHHCPDTGQTASAKGRKHEC